MITLKDSIEISVSVDTLYDWLQDLEDNFGKWSPNHEYFEKISGGFDAGDEIRFVEHVMGVPYDIKGIIQKHEKNEAGFLIMFKTMSGLAHIIFIGETTSEGCRFTHIEEFGKPDTFFGKIFNWILFNLLARNRANWQLIKNDMVNDNIYLKQILETGVCPSRKGSSNTEC